MMQNQAFEPEDGAGASHTLSRSKSSTKPKGRFRSNNVAIAAGFLCVVTLAIAVAVTAFHLQSGAKWIKGREFCLDFANIQRKLRWGRGRCHIIPPDVIRSSRLVVGAASLAPPCNLPNFQLISST